MREQLDRWERLAHESAKTYPSPWTVYDRGHSAKLVADAPPLFRTMIERDQDDDVDGTDAYLGDPLEHIAAHDPDRTLALVQALRRILDAYPDAAELLVPLFLGERPLARSGDTAMGTNH